MVQKPCSNCGDIVERPPSRMPDGNDVYCSRDCMKGKNYVQKPCSTCGKTVERYPSQMSDGDVYCSRSCINKGRTPHNKTEIYVECQICGKEIRERPCENRVACSQECYAEYSSEVMSGRYNHNWKEYAPFHTDFLGYERCVAVDEVVKIHRLAAVAWFGFDAVVNKDVHHENNIPWDNREENLIPMDKSEHMRLHENWKHTLT